ncbi:MAG: YihY/virulence factor BrkB family protein [Sphingobacteriales bacterium]|nr:MAG: YihY/virulence factor BrkB family protein [Sphingobacteriales bacterium]
MSNLRSSILNWPVVRQYRNWARRASIPGSDGMSLHEVSKFFILELKSNRLNVSCAAVTYNFLMAIPPTLLFLFSLVPYFPLGDVQQTILGTLRMVTPNERAYDGLSRVITDFMNNEQEGVLSFGILSTIFFSSNGMMGLIRNFERSLPIYVKRTGIKKRWTAIKLTLMLICVAILSLAVFIIQVQELNSIILSVFNNTVVIRMVSLLFVTLIVFCTISVIYTYGPSLSHRSKFVSPGSVFATVLCVLATTVFFFLVNHFIHYNQVYGSIGSIMAFMAWVWLNTMVILIGYELNVSILLARHSNNKIEIIADDEKE